MRRKALIVAGAAGPDETVHAVLQRFGFDPAVAASNLSQAIARLRDDHFDLVIIPLQDIDPIDLATLEREIRKGKSTSVIGTAAQAEPDLILRAMRSGIHEFLVFPPDPKDLAGAVDRLLRRGFTEGTRGTTVAVYSAKGGLGTSTVAVNLAYGFAKNNPDGRVALADLVVSGGDIGVMLDLRGTYDIGDLVAKVNRIDADLLYSLLTPCAGGVWVLPSGDKPEVADTIDGASVATIIQQLRSSFTFSVFDCEHHLSERTLAALDAADRLVLVTQLNVAALRSTQRTLALCHRLGYADEKLYVVVNRHHSGDVISFKDAAELLEREISWKIPNDYRTSAGALNKGLPVAEFDAGSQLAWSYTALAAKLGGGSGASGPHENGRARASRLTQLLGFGRKS